MNKRSYFLILWLVGLLLSQPSYAQYAAIPPAQDGTITAAEYGSNQFQTTSGGTWYMTWDANNLYVAKTGGQNAEASIMYLDLNPLLPVTGGGVTQGNLTGNEDYSVTPALPFRGDVRVFFTDKYVEVRRATGYGGWDNPIITDLVVSNTGTNRELRLSWNSLTGGSTIPPSFNWLAYAINQGSGTSNSRYDLAPDNPGAAGTAGGTTPPLEYYFTVVSTANGSATKPFTLRSYTFLGKSNVDSFGAIDVWDFTMNSPNLAISRGTTGGNWNISGSLVVNAGTVYFGNTVSAPFGDTNVGNIRMLGNGVLDMDQTNKPLNVREDVLLTGGSQLILSGIQGADLNVGRDFIVTNGMTTPATFQANKRTVTFTGTNLAHRIQATNNYTLQFSYLTLNSPSSTVTLDNDISILSLLTFNQGLLNTGSHFIQLDGAAFLGTETAGSHVVGNVRITQNLDPSNTNGFGNVGLRVIPQNGTPMSGRVTLTRTTGTSIPGVGSSGNSIQRYFQLATSDVSFANPNFLVEFAYRLDELNGTPEKNLALYQSIASLAGPYARLSTPPVANTSTHTVTYNYQTALANNTNTYLTLGDGTTPLPVTLVSFTAQATPQGNALLRWATASELNSKGFGIERQLGNGTWQSVGYVAATNHATGSDYTFTDQSLALAPASPQAYYRLRQEDLDGTLSYSPVAVVARPAEAGSTKLVLSPVPVSGASLSLSFAEAGQSGSDVTVSNAQGQRMLHFTTETSADVALSLPVEKLSPGVYIVRVQVPGQGARYARFVKQ